MQPFTELLKRHSLIAGIVLMFLFTWPFDLANAGILSFNVPFIFVIFLGWGFVFASIIMTGLTLGREGVVSLFKRYLLWHVSGKWFVAALLLSPTLVITGVYINAALKRVIHEHKVYSANTHTSWKWVSRKLYRMVIHLHRLVFSVPLLGPLEQVRTLFRQKYIAVLVVPQ